ncbi:hypothetical protein JCM3775_004848 [Rhodotorula graminis]
MCIPGTGQQHAFGSRARKATQSLRTRVPSPGPAVLNLTRSSPAAPVSPPRGAPSPPPLPHLAPPSTAPTLGQRTTAPLPRPGQQPAVPVPDLAPPPDAADPAAQGTRSHLAPDPSHGAPPPPVGEESESDFGNEVPLHLKYDPVQRANVAVNAHLYITDEVYDYYLCKIDEVTKVSPPLFLAQDELPAREHCARLLDVVDRIVRDARHDLPPSPERDHSLYTIKTLIGEMLANAEVG